MDGKAPRRLRLHVVETLLDLRVASLVVALVATRTPTQVVSLAFATITLCHTADPEYSRSAIKSTDVYLKLWQTTDFFQYVISDSRFVIELTGVF